MNTKQEINVEQSILINSEERAFAREELVYNVTEDFLVILEDFEITKKELARRLGKSRSYVTQILSGSRNMTLGSFSDICFALGFKPEIKLPVQDEAEVAVKKVKHFIDTWITQEKDSHKHSEVINKTVNVIDRRADIHWAKVA
ncbi:transcriptional regulator [Colwelliaceae bacterium BS250]